MKRQVSFASSKVCKKVPLSYDSRRRIADMVAAEGSETSDLELSGLKGGLSLPGNGQDCLRSVAAGDREPQTVVVVKF